MEASSKVVSFLFISILSGQSSCALFSRPRSRYALEVVFAASVKSLVEAVVAVLRDC